MYGAPGDDGGAGVSATIESRGSAAFTPSKFVQNASVVRTSERKHVDSGPESEN